MACLKREIFFKTQYLVDFYFLLNVSDCLKREIFFKTIVDFYFLLNVSDCVVQTVKCI